MRLQSIIAAAALAALPATAQRACNNAPALCDVKYNEAVQLGAHDSPFVRDASTKDNIAGDQFYNSTVQLSAGVRMLSAQVHKVQESNGTNYNLCHTNCGILSAGSLVDWLKGLKSWLDANPDDVVSILLVNSDAATAEELDGQFQLADIKGYTYTPPETTTPTTDWPTLGSMISDGKRLVVFIADLDPATATAAPYLLNDMTFFFENSYHNDAPTAFSCAADRPSTDTAALLADGHMPFLNHFLYDMPIPGIEISAPEHSNDTNGPADSGRPGNVGDAANACTKEWGRKPAVVFVDFFNAGPAIATVDELNGVTGQTSGRSGPGTSLSASDEGTELEGGLQGAGPSLSSGVQTLVTSSIQPAASNTGGSTTSTDNGGPTQVRDTASPTSSTGMASMRTVVHRRNVVAAVAVGGILFS